MPVKPCVICGQLSDQARCPDHRRGTTAQRGYGYAHQQQRERDTEVVASGEAVCWRCGEPIDPLDEPWDSGHDDHDRSIWLGPEHELCNRGAPGRRRGRAG